MSAKNTAPAVDSAETTAAAPTIMENDATRAANLTEQKLQDEALIGRKANFSRLFNPKMALLLAKRDEIKRMADTPDLFEGVLTEADVEKVQGLLEGIGTEIIAALTSVQQYKSSGESAPRALREKPKFDLFA